MFKCNVIKRCGFLTKIANFLLDILVKYRYSGPTQSNVDCVYVNNTSNNNKNNYYYLSSVFTMLHAAYPLQPGYNGGSPSPFDTHDTHLQQTTYFFNWKSG